MNLRNLSSEGVQSGMIGDVVQNKTNEMVAFHPCRHNLRAEIGWVIVRRYVTRNTLSHCYKLRIA